MSYSQDNELSGMPLGLLEQARHGLVNKLKVQNNAYQSAGGVGGGLVGTIAGGLAGLLAKKGLRRFAAPAGAMGGGLVGGTVGRSAGGLMGTSIPAAVDQPMTPETIGAVSKFINKQAGIGDSMPIGMGVGGLVGAADAPRGMLLQGAGRGILQGGAAGLGADLGGAIGSELSHRGPASTMVGAGIGGLGGLLLANKLLGHAPVVQAKEKEKALAKEAKVIAQVQKIAASIPPARRSAIKVAIASLRSGSSLESALRKAYPGKTGSERLSWCNNIKAAAEATSDVA